MEDFVFKTVDAKGNIVELRQIFQQSVVFKRGDSALPVGKLEDRLETVDGKPVNHISQGVYEIAGEDGPIRLTSDAPNAP